MTALPRLSAETLKWTDVGVAVPGYARTGLSPGIVHLGLGSFHRVHQAVVADDALARGERDWGIVGVSLRHARVRDALAPQDGLYTLGLRDASGLRLRIIGALIGILVAPEDPEALIARIAAPRTRLVTLTVTEKGYGWDAGRGRLDRGDPGIAHDLAGTGPPVSALGFLAAGLHRRFLHGAPGLTLASCDNLPRNGDMLRRALLEFADARYRGLARWIAAHVACPSSMVDRIAPAVTEADRDRIVAALGLTDASPVIAEPAFDWVIEDRFMGPRPPFGPSGVQFVTDTAPFEEMKLRLLNGAHTALAAIGRLAGLTTVAEAAASPPIARFLERYWDEAAATLAIDPRRGAAYRAGLSARFTNPALPHTLAQIATDASQKAPPRLIAPLRSLLRARAPADAITFALAAWIASNRGTDDAGRPLPVDDPVLARWPGRPHADAGAVARTTAMLGYEPVFGTDLPRHSDFTDNLKRQVQAIEWNGVIPALEASAA